MPCQYMLAAGLAAMCLAATCRAEEAGGNPKMTDRMIQARFAAAVKLRVKDEAGKPLPFRGELWSGQRRLDSIWSSDGTGEVRAPEGESMLLVRHGFDYDAVEVPLDLGLEPKEVTKDVTLHRRFDLRALGWFGGENHMHGQHGKKDPPRTFKDGARMAAADGVDYLQIAYAWEPTFSWVPSEELEKWSREASTPQVAVRWNTETPKCYMGEDDGGEKGNLHCYGHGLPIGLKDNSKGMAFFHTGPAFRAIQEIHRQGAVVLCAHPVRFWFNKGNFVSNWASELPFDYVAGCGYDGVDVLHDCPLLFFQSERLWWNLLNMGYKVAGTANSDGSLGDPHGVGRFRTYMKIEGEFSWDKIAEAVRRGACIASSGPMVLFEVDGRPSGAEFPADGKEHKATVRAWSAPLPGETLVSVQLVRNGEVVRAWDLRKEKLREWKTEFAVGGDDAMAWYAVRVLSTCRNRESVAKWGPDVYEVAVANPVYFVPRGFKRPGLTYAHVTITVQDEAGKPVAGRVVVVEPGGEEGEPYDVPPSGILVRGESATASLRITADGFKEERRSLYLDTEIFSYCRNMNLLWPSLYSPETWKELRDMLASLHMTVVMKK